MITRRTFLKTTGLVLGTGAVPASAKALQPQKTILLQCGWALKNIGDIGHTPGTLRFLEQYLPEAKVILWAVQTNEQVDAMLRKRFPKLEIVKGSLAEKNGPVQEAIKRSDLFLRGPGMGQNTDFMQYCSKIGKPWGLQGQSYFPDMVTGPGAKERIALLSSAAFIYCRDSKTLKTLQDAGVKPPVLEFGPDGCFGIDVRDDAKALARMQKHGLEEKKFITIELRTHSPTSPGVDDKRVDIGLVDWAPEFDSTPAEKLFEILIGIHKDYAAAQAKARKAMAYVEERAASQMKVLKSVIQA